MHLQVMRRLHQQPEQQHQQLFQSIKVVWREEETLEEEQPHPLHPRLRFIVFFVVSIRNLHSPECYIPQLQERKLHFSHL